ncbi:glycosyltransferase family 2 protein [Tabrizicola fusiformis]|uniref:glycosyltransferase family 2 protein n=1 Tax=Tabrizicola sp. SY72 TaxID=2741673 RepID=UPI001572A767|nr:glycosyltransferase family 2 protein [Tabrizicola sp. SY72]NTT86557.1 glycosyltransferase family 2 protein [Tabrizicola sp. SY72]
MPLPDVVPDACLMTAVKDEGPDLLEWLAWHRMIGFGRIVVWSNDCSDGSDLMLDRLAAMGWLTHHRHTPPAGLSAQDNVARLALQDPQRAGASWAMWLDADEFLVVHPGRGGLADLLANMGRAVGMAVNWRVFGSSGFRQTQPGQLAVDRFRRSAPLEDTFSRTVKTLYRNGPQIAALGIHRPLWQPGSEPRVLGSRGRPLNSRFLFSPKKNGRPRDMLGQGQQGWNLAQVNHYAVKALDRLALKRGRGNGLIPGATADRFGADYLGWFDRNEEEDHSAARHLPALRDVMAEALDDRPLAALWQATAARQAARLAEVGAWVTHLADLQELRQAG